MYTAMLTFLEAGDLNSGPRADKTSTLTHLRDPRERAVRRPILKLQLMEAKLQGSRGRVRKEWN